MLLFQKEGLAVKRMIFGVALVLGVLAGFAQPASAGIRCSSYSYSRCGLWVCCHYTCVYCEDTVTGEILSEYCSDECWERAN